MINNNLVLNATTVAKRTFGDPLINLGYYGPTQCDSITIQWLGTEPPFTVSVYSYSGDWISAQIDNEANYVLQDILYRNSYMTETSWRVAIPSNWSVSFRVVDSLGRNYTTWPKVVGESSDSSCVPSSLLPLTATASAQATQDINYNYNYNNSGRLVTSIVLLCISISVTAIFVGLIIWCCRRRSKKRQKERLAQEANRGPVYAQFYPSPGAEPVMYVQLAPGTPFVPAGATPEEAARTGAPQLLAEPERATLLSRPGSPAMSQVSGPAPSQTTAPTMSQMGGPVSVPVPETIPANAVASGSGTRHSDERQ